MKRHVGDIPIMIKSKKWAWDGHPMPRETRNYISCFYMYSPEFGIHKIFDSEKQ